uniref:Protein FAM177A1 n=1 Tax=Timema douglasi TaxID=61478 RepID=A0A7R8VDH3_TIMDO|nr:unnamed protein product [Timema douglasi]
MNSGDSVTEPSQVFSNISETNHLTKSSSKLVDKDNLTEVSLGKAPRKVLHFSDGTLEEYSTDEDESDIVPTTAVTNEINPKTLTWGPWTLYHVATAGSKTLQVCDYLGESLANFFGITTPKYQYEIDEYHRMLAEEEERQRQLDLEMGGWTDKYSQQVISLQEVTQPSSTNEIQQAGDSNRY